jgi:hypothetical protein
MRWTTATDFDAQEGRAHLLITKDALRKPPRAGPQWNLVQVPTAHADVPFSCPWLAPPRRSGARPLIEVYTGSRHAGINASVANASLRIAAFVLEDTLQGEADTLRYCPRALVHRIAAHFHAHEPERPGESCQYL